MESEKPPIPTEGIAHRRGLKRSEELEEEDRQIEEEYARICMVQAHAPWTESRFAKYLTVEPISEPDISYEAEGPNPEEPKSTASALDGSQHAKRLRQAANRLRQPQLQQTCDASEIGMA
ncbi:hypothetical protein DFH09DRAFT_1088482 [Mycena vulgaris]|nr:hypothetical protein DFH09DRAFT_1088482 [Mycena vulgaris]